VAEARSEGAAGTARATGSEGPEGGAQLLEVAPAAARAAMAVLVLVSMGTHRNHSIPSLICRDASTIYRRSSFGNTRADESLGPGPDEGNPHGETPQQLLAVR